jgi:hypothetical protein
MLFRLAPLQPEVECVFPESLLLEVSARDTLRAVAPPLFCGRPVWFFDAHGLEVDQKLTGLVLGGLYGGEAVLYYYASDDPHAHAATQATAVLCLSGVRMAQLDARLLTWLSTPDDRASHAGLAKVGDEWLQVAGGGHVDVRGYLASRPTTQCRIEVRPVRETHFAHWFSHDGRCVFVPKPAKQLSSPTSVMS